MREEYFRARFGVPKDEREPLMTYRISPPQITSLKTHQVFVFGSNLSGAHGAGAAKFAATFFGARRGKGEGHFGQSYALPTKDRHIRTLPLTYISKCVNRFLEYARGNPRLDFLVTEIGCGLAGYEPKEIAPLFQDAIALPNIYLPRRFSELLRDHEPEMIKTQPAAPPTVPTVPPPPTAP